MHCMCASRGWKVVEGLAINLYRPNNFDQFKGFHVECSILEVVRIWTKLTQKKKKKNEGLIATAERTRDKGKKVKENRM